MTTWQLKQLYKDLNKKYFSNKLPDIWVHFSERKLQKALGSSIFRKANKNCQCSDCKSIRKQPFIEIRIHKKLNTNRIHAYPIQVIQTLLHEMIHINLWINTKKHYNHGGEFKKEIKRLFSAGAYNGLL